MLPLTAETALLRLPFASVSDSFVGFDIEIAELVAGKLGFGPDKITFTPLDLGQRENAIATGAVDMVVAAYPISDQSKKGVSFAGPYLVNALNMLLRAGESLAPNSMRGHKVCTVTGSFASAHLKAVGIDNATSCRRAARATALTRCTSGALTQSSPTT